MDSRWPSFRGVYNQYIYNPTKEYVILKKEKEAASAMGMAGLNVLSGGFGAMTSMFSAPVVVKAAAPPPMRK
jgi:hypothetical protein